MEEPVKFPPRFAGAFAGHHFDAGGAQGCHTIARDPGVGVGHRHHDTGNPRGNQGPGARRRPPVVGTGLQRGVGGGAPCSLARRSERHGFGMGASARLGPAEAHDPVLAVDDNAANRGVLSGCSQGPPRKPPGIPHPAVVGVQSPSLRPSPSSPESSPRSSSKSLASRKFL